MVGAYVTYGDRKDAYRVLVGRPYVKRPIRRPGRGWEGDFKMDLQEVGLVGMDWIALALNRDRWRTLEDVVMNFRVP
jgi:hypothetical protein